MAVASRGQANGGAMAVARLMVVPWQWPPAATREDSCAPYSLQLVVILRPLVDCFVAASDSIELLLDVTPPPPPPPNTPTNLFYTLSKSRLSVQFQFSSPLSSS